MQRPVSVLASHPGCQTGRLPTGRTLGLSLVCSLQPGVRRGWAGPRAQRCALMAPAQRANSNRPRAGQGAICQLARIGDHGPVTQNVPEHVWISQYWSRLWMSRLLEPWISKAFLVEFKILLSGHQGGFQDHSLFSYIQPCPCSNSRGCEAEELGLIPKTQQ